MPNTFPGPYAGNIRNDYVSFTGLPIVQEAVTAASIGLVTINHTNKWYVEGGKYIECYNTTTISQVAPSVSAQTGVPGLNIGSLLATNAYECEITQGNSATIKNAFTVNTSPSFFVRATFNVKTLASTTECTVGFRLVQTYDASPIADYTDYAMLGLSGTGGKLQTQTRIASAAAVVTDTTQTITAATNFTVQVNIDGSGNVTYLWASGNGVLAAPTTVVAAQLTTASAPMIPWIHVKQAAGAHDEVDLISYACGLL